MPASSSSAGDAPDGQAAADDRGLAGRADQQQAAATRSAKRGRQRRKHQVADDAADPEARGDHAPTTGRRPARPRRAPGRCTNTEGSTTAWYVAIPARKASTHDRDTDLAPAAVEAGPEVVGAGDLLVGIGLHDPRPQRAAAARRDRERRGVEQQRPAGAAGEGDQQAPPAPGRPPTRPRTSARAVRWRAAGWPARRSPGSSPVKAGAKNASEAPYTAATATRSPTPACPLTSSRPAVSWQAIRTTSETMRIRLRS